MESEQSNSGDDDDDDDDNHINDDINENSLAILYRLADDAITGIND